MLNNLIVKPFGFEPINWTKDPQFILFALVLQSVWRWTGFIAFFVLCGMDALPKGYSEAARLEGVGQWRFLFFVTLPLVRHILIFACIFLLVDAFSMFSEPTVYLEVPVGLIMRDYYLLPTYTIPHLVRVTLPMPQLLALVLRLYLCS